MRSSARVTDADQERLERYLRREAAEGEAYIKSKFVADEVNLTPSQVGLLLTRLQEADGGVDIEKWSYANATTWRVRAGD
ncbi:hypothetical protein BRC85_04380 [Halobacteriales archaeon QS_1_69_70]|nr:MAG: hypothetical protein BRC85_04380 [Halobacteriales archaeon QS_1_69_70]